MSESKRGRGYKNGREFPCKGGCGKLVYRNAYDQLIKRKFTCGSPECKTAAFSGKNNPFWGKKHSEETRRKIREGRAKNPPKGTGPPKGFKHTEEARRKIGEASKRLWREKRQEMIASLPRGVDHFYYKSPKERRYRQNWTPVQRRDWTGTQCAYCGDTEDLVLDHIIPLFDGGDREHCNAQTLCRACNLWKVVYVDLPRYKAQLDSQGGRPQKASS